MGVLASVMQQLPNWFECVCTYNAEVPRTINHDNFHVHLAREHVPPCA